MLRFMAACLLYAVVLGGLGLVWLALAALGLFFATPFAVLAWHFLGPSQAIDNVPANKRPPPASARISAQLPPPRPFVDIDSMMLNASLMLMLAGLVAVFSGLGAGVYLVLLGAGVAGLWFLVLLLR